MATLTLLSFMPACGGDGVERGRADAGVVVFDDDEGSHEGSRAQDFLHSKSGAWIAGVAIKAERRGL